MTKFNNDVYIYTVVIGFGSMYSDIIFEDQQAHIAAFIQQLKQCVGLKAILMEQKNECVILIMGDSAETNEEIIQALCLWTYRYKERYKDMYFSIAYDRREIRHINIINESAIMARYYMYRNYLSCVPEHQLTMNKLNSFINIFKRVLDDLVEVSYIDNPNEEIMKVSEFIDSLVSEYAQKHMLDKV